jgi:hypothetical protein
MESRKVTGEATLKARDFHTASTEVEQEQQIGHSAFQSWIAVRSLLNRGARAIP